MPEDRLLQLQGGVDAWVAAGGALEVPAVLPAEAQAAAGDLGALLAAAGLSHITPMLATETFEAAQAAALASRPAFILRLKELGVSSLSERQKVATLCAKAARAATG